MKFLKRASCLLLALISTLIFSICITGCEEDTPSSQSSFSEESISSITENPSESSPDSNPNEDDTFFKATFDDVIFDTVPADDGLSVLFNVTPKFHIYNLTIQVRYLYLGVSVHHESKTFEQAPAYQTISFRIYQPERYHASGNRIVIDTYEFDVVEGLYSATQETFLYTFNSYQENPNNDILAAGFLIAEDKKNVLVDISTYTNVYDLEITTTINLQHHSIAAKSVIVKNIEYCSANRILTFRFFPESHFLEQNLPIQSVELTISGVKHIPPQKGSTPTADYWKQFK